MDTAQTTALDTHAPGLLSWVDSANDPQCPFPIQNLPFGRFRRDEREAWSLGVAIGDQVLDLHRSGLFASAEMSQWLALAPPQRAALRQRLSQALRRGSELRPALEPALHALHAVELGVPCEVRNYTDFFVGIHHAERTGRLYRPEMPLLPNYRWVPIGYHGRASTVQASGRGVIRPLGQTRPPAGHAPALRPTERLDFELEMGVVIGRGNAQGEPIAMHAAEAHIAGLTLLNDWSARDIQAWEAQPLGPFLAKNFATTLSPWIVTTEALQPFRRPFHRAPGEPQPLPYLDSEANRAQGAVDVTLEVWLQTPRMREQGQAGECIVRSNFADAAYWTMAQLVAHHTINGCALLDGDLLGTGTLSGSLSSAYPSQAGCLLEITHGGQSALALSNGEERRFLHDGDTVLLRGYCERPGFRRIGFGDCVATVRPAGNPSK